MPDDENHPYSRYRSRLAVGAVGADRPGAEEGSRT